MTTLTEPATMSGSIVARATVETIVRQRNRALELYRTAHEALTSAADAAKAAHAEAYSLRKRENAFNYHLPPGEFMHVAEPQDQTAYMARALRIVDTAVWAHVIEVTDLERLMDKQAKDQLRQQLVTDPPEVTAENIYATLDRFLADAGMIFRRGIANAFSKLDRRFKSHDGFKIGSRVILTRMFDEHGWWNHHRDQESTLMDIERAFLVLDGKPIPTGWGGIVGILRNVRGFSGARQTEVENEHFLIRVFKNGNAHLWFRRKDLVEKVNKLLAEYYGEVIPDGQTPEDDGGLFTPKTTPARRYGFFPTPDRAAEELIGKVPLHREEGAPPLTILEPSAGTANLANRLAATREQSDGWGADRSVWRFRHIVDCVEIQPNLVEALRANLRFRKVYGTDFLALRPETTGLYDRVVMNPPFDRERDIDHVIHALQFLKPGGFLAAIMSAGTEFRETRKSVAFRNLMTKMNARWQDLPAGSFAESGTNCNTLILTVWKDGRKQW